MSNYHLYGIGAALVDTEIEVSDADLAKLNIEKGIMTLVDEARQEEIIAQLSDHLVASKRASGGSAANTVIAASQFGANSFYSCKVSDDENGDFYLQDLELAGVDYNQDVAREAGITGKCLVMITPDAERSMNTFLGISESISNAELHMSAAANSEYVYLEGYQVTSDSGRQATIELRQHAEANGVKTAMSLSDPAMVEFFRDGLQEMIGDKVSLLFCNEQEAMGFTQTDTLEAAAAALKTHAHGFAITLGAKGALVFDGDQQTMIEAYNVTAIDTNGAGDMFAGAFLYAITHGLSFAQAGKLASRAAAQVVSQFGPRLRREQHAEILTEVLG